MVTFLTDFLASWPIRLLAFLADTSIIIVVVKWIIGRTFVTIHLTSINATFKIRRKDFNVQVVTNEVSRHFMGGERLPAEVRKEIIAITQSLIKDWTCPPTTESVDSKSMVSD